MTSAVQRLNAIYVVQYSYFFIHFSDIEVEEKSGMANELNA